jgi:uncharacterized protein (TIGR04222 family)
MDWLTHNAIAEIPGPLFLWIYCVVALAVVAAAYRMVRSLDKTGSRAPPPVPSTFDPYELAYLRGGKNEVIRTALYALHQLGLIEVIPAKRSTALRLVAVADVDRARELAALEERVLRSINYSTQASYLFQSGSLESDVERLCEPFRNKLESEELLRSDNVRGSALLIPFLASAFLVVLCLYGAVNNALPFGFLLILTMISLFLVWNVVAPVARVRISGRGRAYLNRLRIAYAQMQPAAPRVAQSPQPDLASVGLVGLFGLGILSGTPDEAFASIFSKNKASAALGGCSATGGCGGGHGHGGGHGCGGGHGGGHSCGGGHGCGGGGDGGGCGSSG